MRQQYDKELCGLELARDLVGPTGAHGHPRIEEDLQIRSAQRCRESLCQNLVGFRVTVAYEDLIHMSPRRGARWTGSIVGQALAATKPETRSFCAARWVNPERNALQHVGAQYPGPRRPVTSGSGSRGTQDGGRQTHPKPDAVAPAVRTLLCGKRSARSCAVEPRPAAQHAKVPSPGRASGRSASHKHSNTTSQTLPAMSSAEHGAVPRGTSQPPSFARAFPS